MVDFSLDSTDNWEPTNSVGRVGCARMQHISYLLATLIPDIRRLGELALERGIEYANE